MKQILTIAVILVASAAAFAQKPATLADSVAYYLGKTEGAFAKYKDSPENSGESVLKSLRYVMDVNPAEVEALKRALGMRIMLDELQAKGFDVNKYAVIEACAAALNEPAPDYWRVQALSDSTRLMLSKAEGKADRIEAERMAAELKKNKEAGAAFVAAAKKKDKNIKTTESGLSYKVLKKGKGFHPTDKDKVKVQYAGRLIDGTEFDSSYKRGEPATFGVNQLIPGFTEGLKLMTPGSKFLFYIPSDIGYGDRGMGKDIKPGDTLMFEVELLDINPDK